MPTEIKVSALYKGNADEIFKSALNFQEFVEAMSGIAVYKGIPDRTVEAGETIIVDVTFWGFLKSKGHVIHLESIDFENRVIQSREHNKTVQTWDHMLSVRPEGDFVRWTDRVIIDAGWLTAGTVKFALYVYKHRHRYRKALKIEAQSQKYVA